MTHGWLAGATTLIVGAAVVTMSAANPGIILIGTGVIPSTRPISPSPA